MMLGTSLPALYSAPLILWVEDPVVRDYLSSVWGDSDLRFLIAGGNAGISPVVRSARQEGHTHVYGLVDRDFRTSNRPNWLNPASDFTVFVPEAHEIENYLLDPQALAGCSLNTGGQSAAAIEARLVQRASELTWWMACRAVLAELRQPVIDGFPRHPGPPLVTNLATAEAHICSSQWYVDLPSQVAAITTQGHVANRLRHFQGLMQRSVAAGEWKRDFSGKELFRSVRDWVYRGGTAGHSARDSDLAKAIGTWQREHAAIPAELAELRTAIRTRAGLPP
jgi:hypothetical protein